MGIGQRHVAQHRWRRYAWIGRGLAPGKMHGAEGWLQTLRKLGVLRKPHSHLPASCVFDELLDIKYRLSVV